MNAVADAAPGFRWRLQSEAGDATAIRVFGDAHRGLLRGRRQWFHRARPRR
ncbi:DUF3291 domain-containing protein [Lentzea nigeriaca]|uniref:DUF3291 domain-containing protein n=1 Tax=Lentzea nigeriaca TaxID=1128665 RepID=UPI0027DC0847|nr:DUF3291 domain-containing protein [Lentzea nigeriaca]MBM7857844.1 hypothetical protein [Lentzea nigeriaca]